MSAALEQNQQMQDALRAQMGNASTGDQLQLASRLGSLVMEAAQIQEKEQTEADAKAKEERGALGAILGAAGEALQSIMDSVLESVHGTVAEKGAAMDGTHAAALALAEARGMDDPHGFAMQVMQKVGKANLGRGGDLMTFRDAVEVVAPEIAAEGRESAPGAHQPIVVEKAGELSPDQLRDAVGREGLAQMRGEGDRGDDVSAGRTGQLGAPSSPGHQSPIERATATRTEGASATR